MLKVHPRRGQTGEPGRSEHPSEVIGLAGVHHIQNDVGAQVIHPHLDSRQVGGGVQGRPVGFAQKEGRQGCFVLGLSDLHHRGPLALGHPSAALHTPDHLFHPVGNGALAVPEIELHPEPGKVGPLALHGDANHLLPQGPIPRPPLLQLQGGPAGSLRPLGVGGAARRDLRIHFGQFLQADRRLGRETPLASLLEVRQSGI